MTSHGDRADVPNIAVVIWNGQVKADTDIVLRTAIDLRQLGVRLVVLGLGTDVEQFGLKMVASPPTNDTVFVVPSAANLSTVTAGMISATCDGEPTVLMPRKAQMYLHFRLLWSNAI